MNYEIGDSKYITLVGSIQSGKTNEESVERKRLQANNW